MCKDRPTQKLVRPRADLKNFLNYKLPALSKSVERFKFGLIFFSQMTKVRAGGKIGNFQKKFTICISLLFIYIYLCLGLVLVHGGYVWPLQLHSQ